MAIINSFVQQRHESQSGPRANGYSKRDFVGASPRHGAGGPEAINERELNDTLNQSAKVHSQLQLQEALNQTEKVRSLTQLQRMLNGSPRVVAQAKLSKALSGPAGTAQRRQESEPVHRQDTNEHPHTFFKPIQAVTADEHHSHQGSASLNTTAPGGVIQGVFDYKSKTITEKTAKKTASQIYEKITSKMNKSKIKMDKDSFIKLVEDLAQPDLDHGELDDIYFSRLISEGQISEKFSFEKSGRRIFTLSTSETNYPPIPSFFQQKLTQEKHRDDFSYEDLRKLMQKVLEKDPTLEEEQIDDAIREGVKNFNPLKTDLTLSTDYNTDLQLLVQHLLKYQSFNRGMLKDLPKNKIENAYRFQEMEKSKLMISVNPSFNLDKIIPPTPDFERGGHLRDAMPALIDLNRPLSNSVFEGETYKAVFILAHKLYREAFDQAQKSLKSQKKLKPTQKEQILEQRNFFNSSLFKILPEMTNSTIVEGEGKDYVVNQLGFNFDEEAESFDEASSSEEDYSDQELSSDEEIYNSEEDLFLASFKRSTFLNSFGLFAKMSSQKELLDPETDENVRKYKRLDRRIKRRTRLVNKKYKDRFKVITKELTYANNKEKLILEKIDEVKEKLEPLEKISPKKRSKKEKEEISSLREAQQRAEELYVTFEDFYSETSIGELVEKNEEKSTWKNDYPEVFGKFGPTKMDNYVYGTTTKRKRATKKRSDSPPKKKRKTTKGSK